MEQIQKKTKDRLYFILVLCALAAGFLFGAFFPGAARSVSFLGTAYVSLLKLIVVPLLMCQVFSSVAENASGTGKTLVKTIVLFFLLFAATFLLTALIVTLVRPGTRFILPAVQNEVASADTGLGSIAGRLISSNIVESMASGNLLPCLLFALVCGLAASKLPVKTAVAVISDFSGILSKVLSWIMYLTPVGVFSLMASAAADNGLSVLTVAAEYILLGWGCSLAALLLVMFLPVCLFRGIRPGLYFRAMLRVWTVSFSTCSSVATLPATLRACTEDFGVPKRIASIVVPLGCTIHMCGGAVSFCLLALFTSQAAGIPVSFGLFLSMVLYAELLNMAAPGIPGGGIPLATAYLAGLGLPLGFVGIYSGIYHVLDMIYTTLNVTGDVTAGILMNGSKAETVTEKERDAHA